MLRNLGLGLFAILLLAGPVAAASVPIAEQSYVSGFREHWSGAFAKQSTIVMGVLVAGAIGIFIITRGKRLK